MRWIAFLAAGTIVPAAALSPLASQEVIGVARAGSSGLPLPEATVVLVNAAGVVVSGTITRSGGNYTLVAPSSGDYRVRARRIGFSPDSSGLFRLETGSIANFDPRLNQFTAQLPAVRVEETRRCTMRPKTGAVSVRLWQEAQNALAATAVTAGNARIGFVLRRFERERDPTTSRVIQSRTWEGRTLNLEPYASIAAESLAVHGFVRILGKVRVFYAPDAKTLTSDVFARTHCFRPVEDASHPGLSGLGFEPIAHPAKRGSAEVAGVMWLDRNSSELRFLEFKYAQPGLENGSFETASGRVEYRRLPTGAWIVNRWIIRMPVVRTDERGRFLAAEPRTNLVQQGTPSGIISVWEGGGEVTGVFAANDSTASVIPLTGSIDGRVVDAGDHTPVRRGVTGVVMILSRTSDSAGLFPQETSVTDTTGTFAFDGVPAGDYVLHAESARFDTLDIRVADRPVRVSAGAGQSMLLTIPPDAAVIAALCPAGISSRAAVIHGTVRDSADGKPVPSARVIVSWLDSMTDTTGRSAMTDNDGHYVVCGLPAPRTLLVRAATGMGATPRLSLQSVPGVVRMYDIVIHKTP